MVAQLGTTYHTLSLSFESWSFSVTSAGDIAATTRSCQYAHTGQRRGRKGTKPPGKSCLLANTSNSDSFISRSWIIRCSSCRASSMRSRSLLSITKIRPCVPVDYEPPRSRKNVSHSPPSSPNGLSLPVLVLSVRLFGFSCLVLLFFVLFSFFFSGLLSLPLPISQGTDRRSNDATAAGSCPVRQRPTH